MTNKELKEIMLMYDDGIDSPDMETQFEILPKQKEFLRKLQTFQNQDKFTPLEQLCIAHCVKYNHYSNIHKDTLNSLIKKYRNKIS